MELFIFDVILGIFFVIGLLMAALGARMWRYRGGKGPPAMVTSGIAFALPGPVLFIGYLIGREISVIIPIAMWSAGAVLLFASILLWRRGR